MRAFTIPLISFLALALGSACSRSIHQKDFGSEEEAAQALVAAVQSGDKGAILEVLGAPAEPAIDSGDPVQDKNARERFLKAFAAAHAFDKSVANQSTLEVGLDNWPFPFPVVASGERWIFDSAQGVDEVVNRRVGRNELAAIQACLAFVDAQREYYASNPQNEPVLQFAQKLISSEGKRDGLYWPTTHAEPPSPLGAGFARARAEGYFQGEIPKAEPFHGYMYRLIKKQGTNARGGAYDYMVNDKMFGGFALLAFPAEYGSSGVMSFVVNYDGVVFSKDLGPETAQIVKSVDAFDPDASWKREATIE